MLVSNRASGEVVEIMFERAIKEVIMFLRGVYQLVLVLLLVMLSNTVYGAKLPEFYGVYAVDKGKLHELQWKVDSADQNFGPKVRLLVFKKWVSMVGDRIWLQRLVYVRNQFNNMDMVKAGYAELITRPYNKWHLGSGHYVKIRRKPVKGESEMIYIVPRRKLRPGLYAITSKQNKETLAHFYVKASLIPKNLVKSKHCVDLYMAPGRNNKEVPCSKSAIGSKKKSSKNNKKMEALLELRVASKKEYRQFIKDEKKRSAAAVGRSKSRKTSTTRDKANAAYQSRDYKKTIKIYREILQNDSKDWWAHAVLGHCYIETGKLDKAFKHLSTAIQKLPADFLFAIVYDAYATKGNMPTALLWLEKALKSGYSLNRKDARDMLTKANSDARLRKLLKKYRVKVAS